MLKRSLVAALAVVSACHHPTSTARDAASDVPLAREASVDASALLDVSEASSDGGLQWIDAGVMGDGGPRLVTLLRGAGTRGGAIGDAFGYGGLGRAGTGVGGGGSGEGTLGLGTLGTMGHGAGTGTGSGYGAGRRARYAIRSAEPPPASATRERAVRGRGGEGPGACVGDGCDQDAARLTATAVGDSDHWGEYRAFVGRHPELQQEYGITPARRVRFRVTDAEGHPVNGARVTVTGDALSVRARTHADGGWDFVPGALGVTARGALTATVEAMGQRVTRPVPDGEEPELSVRLEGTTRAPTRLDLAFVLDVTGSMGDELDYVTREVSGVVRRVQSSVDCPDVRVSATFYQDRSDPLVVQQIAFTPEVDAFARVMRDVRAGGGGDYPEEMNAGLEAALRRLPWSDGDAVRVVVLIADAPPHVYADAQYTWRDALRDATERGVRVLPVAASGADRAVEYLFRAMGAATTAPYVHLTDDSGIGGRHLAADSHPTPVERFNDLLTRLLVSELRGQGMHAAAQR